MSAVPREAIPRIVKQLPRLNAEGHFILDRDSLAMLAAIDGHSPVDEIARIHGDSRTDAGLTKLIALGAVQLEANARGQGVAARSAVDSGPSVRRPERTRFSSRHAGFHRPRPARTRRTRQVEGPGWSTWGDRTTSGRATLAGARNGLGRSAAWIGERSRPVLDRGAWPALPLRQMARSVAWLAVILPVVGGMVVLAASLAPARPSAMVPSISSVLAPSTSSVERAAEPPTSAAASSADASISVTGTPASAPIPAAPTAGPAPQPTATVVTVAAIPAPIPTPVAGIVPTASAERAAATVAVAVTAPDTVVAAASPGAQARLPRVLLDESFDDNRRGWPHDPQSTAWLADGGYRLFARDPGRFVSVAAPIAQTFRDVELTGTFRKVGGPPGGGYGLIVRDQGGDPRDGLSQGGRYYVLEVGDRGELGIWQRDGDRWIDLLPWTPSPVVQPGDATNELKVRAIGDRLIFLVNGVEVADQSAAGLPDGAVGVFAGGDGNQVVLERLIVEAIE